MPTAQVTVTVTTASDSYTVVGEYAVDALLDHLISPNRMLYLSDSSGRRVVVPARAVTAVTFTEPV